MDVKNIAEEVKKRIDEMTSTRKREIEEARKRCEEAMRQEAKAAEDEKNAVSNMDLKAYEAAKKARSQAQNAIDMFQAKEEQIKQQEYISEEESDKVIDSLIEYENVLAVQFEEIIQPHLSRLIELREEYNHKLRECENTIKLWERTIHANYNTRGSALYKDEITGEMTQRAPRPVPVHMLSNVGSKANGLIETYIENGALSEYANNK